MKKQAKSIIFSVIKKLWQELVILAKEYGLSEKIGNIILESGVLDDIQKQIADFALVAVYQAEFAFNKIGKEKKKIAFKMICNIYSSYSYILFIKTIKQASH